MINRHLYKFHHHKTHNNMVHTDNIENFSPGDIIDGFYYTKSLFTFMNILLIVIFVIMIYSILNNL